MHHGNGTQACLARVLPQVVQYSVSTPLSDGSLRFQTYHPWLNEEDADNIIFARLASLSSICAEYCKPFPSALGELIAVHFALRVY